MIANVFTIKTVVALFFAIFIPLLSIKYVKKKVARLCILIGYFGVMLCLTLVRPSNAITGINMVPFWSYRIRIWPEIIQNYLLFVPFGFLVPFSGVNRSWTKTIIIAAIISIGIEIMQYVFRCGFAEFDDVFGNTVGAFIGYIYWKYFSKKIDE